MVEISEGVYQASPSLDLFEPEHLSLVAMMHFAAVSVPSEMHHAPNCQALQPSERLYHWSSLCNRTLAANEVPGTPTSFNRSILCRNSADCDDGFGRNESHQNFLSWKYKIDNAALTCQRRTRIETATSRLESKYDCINFTWIKIYLNNLSAYWGFYNPLWAFRNVQSLTSPGVRRWYEPRPTWQ